MIFWMLYAAGIGILLAAGGWASERFCETMGWPRRFPWMIALTLAVAIPLFAGGPLPAPEAPMASLPAPTAAAEVVAESASASPGPGLDRAALVVWGASSLATLLIFGTMLGVMARARRRWPRRSVDGGEVYVSEGFGPALIGVTRPSVVIPEWLFCASTRAGSVAILHEREHARARDHLALLYGALIVVLFPWSPAVWWMAHNLRGAVEIDCDRRVIASGIPAGDYGRLLLAIGVGQHRRWVFTPALVESRHSLERRLKVMAAKKMKWSPLRAGDAGRSDPGGGGDRLRYKRAHRHRRCAPRRAGQPGSRGQRGRGRQRACPGPADRGRACPGRAARGRAAGRAVQGSATLEPSIPSR